jgi:hypothetical protein
MAGVVTLFSQETFEKLGAEALAELAGFAQ